VGERSRTRIEKDWKIFQLMPTEPLLLSARERPASVFFRGGEVRIGVHDAWHSRTLKRLKADIVALHPDKALSGFRRRRNMPRLLTKAPCTGMLNGT